MEQQTLRQWESRCIQEEMAYCQAACPLHVDVRTFMGLLTKGDAHGARKVLERTMPLPGVLGRVCEAPCEAACKRREAGTVFAGVSSMGDALAVGLLERYALTAGKPGPRPMRLPGKGLSVLILGRGLAALTCAWDLLKKGYGVTLTTLGQPVGGALLALPETELPAGALEAELAVLRALGLVLNQSVGEGRAVLDAALEQGRAVFLEWGFSPATDVNFPTRAEVDAVTLAWDTAAGLFVGGWPDETGRVRHIDAAADGRRAASSLDRHCTGVSLTASREREGVTNTRLFTSLEGVLPAPRVAPAQAEYTAAEAQAEAARCLNCQCLECVRVCAYLEKHKAYPKVYARQIYNNAAIVRGQHLANTLINSCSLCGLCAKVCPEGFSMADLCLTARRDMTQRAVMPQSAHEFALEDMAQASGPDCALTRPAPALSKEVNISTDFLFFPGCQLAASHPHHVESVYAHLRAHLAAPTGGGVGLMLRCCGVPAHWAGEEALFQASVTEFAAQWVTLGRPRIIAACASCLEAFRQPEFQAAAPGLEAVSLWEVLGGLPMPETPVNLMRPVAPLALHDPCTARDDSAFLQAVRTLAQRAGVEVEELPLTGELTECCGFGGLMSQVDAPLARDVAARRAAESPLDYLATCAMCRDRIFAAGKRCWHLLDLLYPSPAHAAGNDPAAMPGPGYSGRQEARAALKTRLLRQVWGELQTEELLQHLPEPVLTMEPELAALLEQRRILLSDIRQTIAQAVATGRYLREETTGRMLAAHRPRRVTFWAEYEPGAKPGEYRLLGAYSHRMITPGAGGVDAAALAQPGDAALVNRVDQTYAPEFGVWRCAECDAPLTPSPVVMTYLGSVFTISLFGCPLCGQTLVPESLALGRMAEVEQLLEDK